MSGMQIGRKKGNKMRTNKIVKNVFCGTAYKIISIIIKFVLRAVLIKGLGDELVGLNTVISDWMSMLNLATLGIEIAIQYSLYRPVAENNIDDVARITRSAQIVYRKIGLIIFVAGLVLMPCVPLLIKDTLYSNQYIWGAYFLSLIGVSASYLWCYKRIVIQAYEEVYIVNIIDMISEILFISLEMFVVYRFRSLYLFMLVGSLKLICQHGITSVLCDKRYGIKKQHERDRNEEKRMVSDLKDVAPLKIANYIYGYTDNVIISKFIGLASVTIYSNYMIIVNAVLGISTMVVNAVKATFGIQLNMQEKKENAYEKLELYIFFQYLFASVAALSFFVIVDTFIELWVGKQYVLVNIVLYMIVIEMFMRMLYQPLQMIFEATGRFKQDKWITLVTALINIVVSIILVHYVGMIGPIIGTMLTDIVIWFYRFRCVEIDFFQQNLYKSIKKWFVFVVTFSVEFILLIILREILKNYISGILYMIVAEIMTLLICLGVNIGFFRKSKEYAYLKMKVYEYVKKRR